jgi:glycosyltransferase involved in cell wall biosynthesis
MFSSGRTSSSLKLAIVVHGRFHAFDLARELIRNGVDVILLTNYPKRTARKFGIPKKNVVNCLMHGVASRVVARAGARCTAIFEPVLHRWFSKWAARQVSGLEVNAIHAFSGVSEELMGSVAGRPIVKSLVRGSAHIRTQARLLQEEQARCGHEMDHPSSWRVAREEREYAMADMIFVLSSFAQKSFEAEGVPRHKVRLVPLGSEISRFRATEEDVARRCERIAAGEPLRVLTVGSFSFRKGALDLIDIATELKGRMSFRFVGDVEAEVLRERAKGSVELIPRQPQFSLPAIYNQADLFVFPTVEDGYAVVLAQAQAAGLPILATPHCAAPDILRPNENGWILPIRSPKVFIEQLKWCDENRSALAQVVRSSYNGFQPRDWTHVAKDLIGAYDDWFLLHPASPGTETTEATEFDARKVTEWNVLR